MEEKERKKEKFGKKNEIKCDVKGRRDLKRVGEEFGQKGNGESDVIYVVVVKKTVVS